MLNPGDRFGDYTVVKLLGRGGMGAVYLLENANGVQVAAKILDPESAGDHESRKRFLREAELALGVKHPNLVETYDVGEDPDTGLCYILMEYVSGGSLADRLDSGPLPIIDAIRIVYQIASVLELAREKGIVHRDIKPANIMFGADGRAKLADLGIARGGVAGTETTVTQTGMMIGTPAYMAPEQMLDAHAVDTRADIYSLGVVFYEMLAGERPNKDDTVVQLMAKAVKGEPLPDVRTLRPEVSAAVAELISLMCAMKADERVATPREVTTALSLIAHGREVTIRRKAPAAVGSRAARGRLLGGVFAATVVGLGVLVWFYVGRSTLSDARETLPKQTGVVVQPVVEKRESQAVHPQTPVPAVSRQRVREVDDGLYRTKTSAGTWTYRVRDGKAWLGDGKHVALDPPPNGDLALPSVLDDVPVVGTAQDAFIRCAGLNRIRIPEGYLTLGQGTFCYCHDLIEVEVPESLQRVDAYVFAGTKIAHLDLKNVSQIDDGRFYDGLVSLERLDFSPKSAFRRIGGDAVLSRDGKRLCFVPRRTREFCIPAGVEEIGPFAFFRSNIEDLVIPSGVRMVSGHAFSRCERLRTISFLGADAKIGEKAFLNNVALKVVELPKDLRSLDARASFSNCRSLAEVVLPDSLEEIGPGVFEKNVKLKRVRFGKRLKSLGYRSFAGCLALEEVTIPASVRTMHPEVFRDCTSLRRVTFEGDAPQLLDNGESQRGVDQFLGAAKELEIVVTPGSHGWSRDGSSTFPKFWPDGAGGNARRIRYGDGKDVAAKSLTGADVRPDFDFAKFADRDPVRRVQKALDALFPGWKLTSGAFDAESLGYARERFGRKDVICTHTLDWSHPIVMVRRMRLTQKNPVLNVSVASWDGGQDVDFRFQVKVNGKTIYDREIRGEGFKDFCFDLSEWRGKDVKIEVIQKENDWFFEMAWWANLEVTEWDGTRGRIRDWKMEVPYLDHRKLEGPPLKRIQKTADILFPGWKMTGTQPDHAWVGYREHYRGQDNLMITHPVSGETPGILSRRVRLPKKSPQLRLLLSSYGGCDAGLRVCINGKVVEDRIVKGEVFQDLRIDLSKWAGKSVKIELANYANDWCHEVLIWKKIDILSGEDDQTQR